MNNKKTRLTFEQLEDRSMPSTVGLPWAYGNLTLSFVPDGTNVDGYQSSLFKTLGSQATTKAWEAAVMKAAQTWVAAANLNIGLTSDSGQALGANGLVQGDGRFGDIRVAAEPMGLTGPLAIGSPFNPVAGTRSGDLVFNSSLTFGVGTQANDIYTVALHELGHSLGLGDNSDPTSVMFGSYAGPRTGVSQGDVNAIQALYGARAADAYAGPTGNSTISSAAVMKLPEIAASIDAPHEADYYRFTIPSYADRTVTVTVQNGGVSLVTPRLSIYSGSGALIATSAAADSFSANVSITLSNVKRGTALYFKVDSASSDAFGVGAYRLKVNSGAVSQKQIAAIDAALNGKIQYVNFGHRTSTISTAMSLDQLIFQTDPRFDYAVNAKLNDASDVDFFSLMTPATAPKAVIFTVAPGQGSLLSAQVTVYDANGNIVDAEILSNEATGYVVQLANPVANASYYVAITHDAFAADCQDKGTYRLTVNYTNTPIVLETLVLGDLSANNTIDVVSMVSTEVQLYHFVLSVDTGGAATGVVVVMQLFDANGTLVTSLVCQDGNTVSLDVQLKKGLYAARFIAISQDGAVIPTTAYSLLGLNLSDPIDPIAVNPTDPSLTPPAPTGTTPPSPDPTLTPTTVAAPVLPPIDLTSLVPTTPTTPTSTGP